jgi:hypothetical protein
MLPDGCGRGALAAAEQKVWQWTGRIENKYNPEQPRVPAGNSDGGQWTAIGGTAGAAVQLAGTVIPICIPIAISLSTVDGYKSYSVTYECRDGRTFVRSGPGHSYRGLVLDPFQKL